MVILTVAAVPLMISLIVVLFFRFVNKKYEPPIFGVYQRRNKYFWFKFVLMYVILRLRQLIVHVKKLLAVELGYSDDGTVHIHKHDFVLEQKYDLGSDPLAVDAVYFNGMSKQGEAVICGVARRSDNCCDAFLYVKVNGEDLLLSPNLPDTRLKQSPGEEAVYSVDGISINNFIPMRTWKVSYNGQMKPRNDKEKRIKVEMDLTWSANWPIFNYDVDMSPLSMAKDISREKWSSDYFKLLKKFYQTHYEQMGYLSGSIFVNGNEHVINMPCLRDHSFGKKREWRNYHRYMLHYTFLENGDALVVGGVSMPVILSHLTIGYYCRKSDQTVLPIKSSDFQLWQHGENQTLPKDYGFVFTAGGESYDYKIKVEDEDVFYIGKVQEAKLHERWCSVEVNGVKGWSCVECHYNNVPAAMG